MGPSKAALGTLILRGNELQSLHGEGTWWVGPVTQMGQDCMCLFLAHLPLPRFPHLHHPHAPSLPLGLEQLQQLRHLDLAYNLLEAHVELGPLHLLAELRKVRAGPSLLSPEDP